MGRVVVGVDGSTCSHQALQVALDEARTRGCQLEVLTAFRPRMVDAAHATWPGETGEEFAAETEAIQREALAGLSDEDLAGVELIRRAVPGDATDALDEASEGADLLVVGSRGRGSVSGALLGSVSLHCVTHAKCPVLVVRPGDDGTRDPADTRTRHSDEEAGMPEPETTAPQDRPAPRFHDILVAATPGRLHPADVARVLRRAATMGAHVTVFDVVEPVPARRRAVEVAGQATDLQELLLQDRCEQLRAAVADLGDPADVTVRVGTGTPVVEVIRQVLAHDHDLVVVGSDPSDDHAGLDAGVSQVLRKCPVPVWVLRPSTSPELRVLALVDPDPEAPDRDSLNDRVLDLATSLVRAEGGELHVGHAWRLPGEAMLRSSQIVGLPAEEVDRMDTAAAADHRARVDDLVRRHGVAELGGQVHVVKGAPGHVLPRLANELSTTLVVMGTLGRTGLSGLVIGNTAETVLRALRCSVLAVKPEGFVSPIGPRHPTEVVEAMAAAD